jgi:hypothetical protein
MKKALLYFTLGTVLSFLINYFFYSSENLGLDIYYALLSELPGESLIIWILPILHCLIGVSFLAMAVLVVVGALLFNLALAIPSILKFSTVFVAYYLIASFRANKSLRD